MPAAEQSPPEKNELAACRPWLDKQIAEVNPAVIVLTGATAVQAVLEKKADLHGIHVLREQRVVWVTA